METLRTGADIKQEEVPMPPISGIDVSVVSAGVAMGGFTPELPYEVAISPTLTESALIAGAGELVDREGTLFSVEAGLIDKFHDAALMRKAEREKDAPDELAGEAGEEESSTAAGGDSEVELEADSSMTIVAMKGLVDVLYGRSENDEPSGLGPDSAAVESDLLVPEASRQIELYFAELVFSDEVRLFGIQDESDHLQIPEVGINETPTEQRLSSIQDLETADEALLPAVDAPSGMQPSESIETVGGPDSAAVESDLLVPEASRQIELYFAELVFSDEVRLFGIQDESDHLQIPEVGISGPLLEAYRPTDADNAETITTVSDGRLPEEETSQDAQDVETLNGNDPFTVINILPAAEMEPDLVFLVR